MSDGGWGDLIRKYEARTGRDTHRWTLDDAMVQPPPPPVPDIEISTTIYEDGRPKPTLPNPYEPLDMSGNWKWNVFAIVLLGVALLFWAYAILSVRS